MRVLMGSNGCFLMSKRGNFGNPARLGRSDNLGLVLPRMVLEYETETCDSSADGACVNWMANIAIQDKVVDRLEFGGCSVEL